MEWLVCTNTFFVSMLCTLICHSSPCLGLLLMIYITVSTWIQLTFGEKKLVFIFLKLYCNDLDMLQIHPLDSWKIPAWEEPCTWEGHRVMYARFLPWLSLHSRVSLHWRCGALVATLYVSLDSNKHPWVGNCIKICDNFLAHFVTRMWRVSYPCTLWRGHIQYLCQFISASK